MKLLIFILLLHLISVAIWQPTFVVVFVIAQVTSELSALHGVFIIQYNSLYHFATIILCIPLTISYFASREHKNNTKNNKIMQHN